jgi:serine/threonine protein kinase
MHHLGFVHTDLKHDNIMFDAGPLAQTDVAALLEEDPSRYHLLNRAGNVPPSLSHFLFLPSLRL